MKSFHPEYYSCGLIYDDSRHYIDHLGPFCSLMGWPLITCENSIAELLRRFYPDLVIVEENFWELELPNQIVTCDPFPLLTQVFTEKQLADRRFFWLPHGNSDKGWQGPFFENLLQTEIALVYGQRMIDFMHAKGISPSYVRIGNFRHFYYQKHRLFYDNLMAPYRDRQNILYAPTWDDSEKSNSFWEAFAPLAASIDSNARLIIKLHPNTVFKFPAEIEQIKGRFEHRANIVFLEDFPPIYPLLQIADIYIGDMSSIGYDFLTFDRPMFFLNPNRRDPHTDQGLSLFSCGEEVNFQTRFLENPQTQLSQQRTKNYCATFSPIGTWENIINEIRRF